MTGNGNTADIEAAHELYQRLKDAFQEGRQDEIIAIRDDPDSVRLIDRLTETKRDRAALYFRDAARWEESRRDTARRRLSDAARALEGLDLQLARGLLARVDSRLLNDEELAEKDSLLLEVSARAMELETLEHDSRRLIAEAEPKRRQWWRRG